MQPAFRCELHAEAGPRRQYRVASFMCFFGKPGAVGHYTCVVAVPDSDSCIYYDCLEACGVVMTQETAWRQYAKHMSLLALVAVEE